MDKIIAAVNRNGTIKAQYSTPSLYYKAKLAEGIDWSVKTDDFFPCQPALSPALLASAPATVLAVADSCLPLLLSASVPLLRR
jgi:hypothetical protein